MGWEMGTGIVKEVYNISKDRIEGGRMKHLKRIIFGVSVVALVCYMSIKIVGIQKGKKGNLTSYTEMHQAASKIDRTSAKEKKVEISKIQYDITDVVVDKKIADGMEEKVLNQDVKIENNIITNEYSVVHFFYTVKNNSTQETLLTLNTNLLRVLEKDEKIEFYEPFFMSPSEYEKDASEYFHVTLKPEESREMEVDYVVSERYLEDRYELQFFINPSGLNDDSLPSPEDDAVKYFAYIDVKYLMQ